MKNKSFVQSLFFRFADNTYMASEHAGTHMDARYHMWEEGWKVGEIPLSRFFTAGQSQF